MTDSYIFDRVILFVADTEQMIRLKTKPHSSISHVSKVATWIEEITSTTKKARMANHGFRLIIWLRRPTTHQ